MSARSPAADIPSPGAELRALAASFLAPAEELPLPAADAPSPGADAPARFDAGGAVTLALSDVLGDGHNEVVFANEAGLGGLVLEADVPVVERGIAPAHVTDAGEDVTGLAYVTFASGITFYFPPELDLATAPQS